MPGEILDRRTLNRTLLHRQGLLEREPRDVRATIEHLVGMQSQNPGDPFVALWSRISGFDPGELDALMLERRAVRTGMMRTTLHLMTAEDGVELAPLFAPVHARTFGSQRAFREGIEGLEIGELVALGTSLIEEAPRTPTELGRALADRWPNADPQAMQMAIRYFVPIVQVTPRGLWRQTMQPKITSTASWLDREVAAHPDPRVEEELVLRYLRAFGPATVGDMRTWSWLTGLRAVVDRVRPGLRVFRDERRRELLDVPDGQIIDVDVDAPVRFLPEYDNLLLSHEDRARIAGAWYPDTSRSRGSVLVDGFVAAGWRVERAKGQSTLQVDCFTDLRPTERDALEEEADHLLAFLAPDAAHRQIEVTRFLG